MNLRHGLKIAKELVGVSITALAAAIADEVKEYDRRFQQGGYRALAKTPASARVLMGLAYAEFLAESTADEELRAGPGYQARWRRGRRGRGRQVHLRRCPNGREEDAGRVGPPPRAPHGPVPKPLETS